MNNFGDFLSQKRRDANLTQKQLANMLFVSESTISKWEKNKANPDISMVCELAKILKVSEHELLTSCVDKEERKKNVYARRWKKLTLTWNLFFIISYSVALFTCFVVNLAVNKTLNWFFIVLFSLILSASFTTIPKYIKRYKLLFIPLIELFSLIALLLICEIYTNGSWFLLATIPILVGFIIVFLPIYLKRYLKNFNHCAIISVAFDIISILIMIFVIELKTSGDWFFGFALPLTLFVSIMPIVFVLVIRYANIAKLLKSIILNVFFIPYLIGGYFITKLLCKNVFNVEVTEYSFPNFANWKGDEMISSNVGSLIIIALLVVSIIQFLLWYCSKKTNR